jgi:hypothetical protein
VKINFGNKKGLRGQLSAAKTSTKERKTEGFTGSEEASSTLMTFQWFPVYLVSRTTKSFQEIVKNFAVPKHLPVLA